MYSFEKSLQNIQSNQTYDAIKIMSSKLEWLSQIRKIIAVAGPLHYSMYLKHYFQDINVMLH